MKTKRILFLSLAVALALILAAGGVLFALSAARRARAVASYRNLTLEKGTYSYFASFYKGLYLASLRADGVGAYDTPVFWELTDSEGVRYGQRLSDGFSDYIRRTLVAASLFDSAAALTAEEKKDLSDAAEAMLAYRADGNKSAFNKMTEKYGFTYDDYVKSITILYKAGKAEAAIYGENGENLKNTADASSYFSANYKHVYLLTLRTSDTFVTDENGNRVTEGGRDLLRDFTESEKAERAALIERVRQSIESRESGEGEMMNLLMFFNLIEKYDDGEGRELTDGYYFSAGSAFGKEFAEEYPSLVVRALEMNPGEYAECTDGEGKICFFLACTEPTASAYTLSQNERFFTDFYSRVADASFEKTLSLFLPDVTLSEEALAFDIVSLPYNSEFVFR